ncbi:hypothetical protein FKR81_06530 [Lentzea tibetensis]|uniref:DUF7674 domain-containing protein n=1 Tax=Lentzea tibetensis TaxID=2591470 RepID=A0A563EZ62_9PSEU|nr:hypothetical protein [Lentzea tibetensis]TWP52781.1 hypothetical protein FKR81_06530 [Lentzea tibetensis]
MVDWRERAQALVPELRDVLEQESWSCHVFLAELSQLAMEAHREGNDDVLRRAYEFAHWCFHQPEQFLEHAALVSFYEHVFDDWALRDEVAPWLPVDVLPKVRALWEWRWDAERLTEVDRLLAGIQPPGRDAV